MLRFFVRPFIRLLEVLYRVPSLRRLMVEFRTEFNDAVPVSIEKKNVYIHVTSRMENQRMEGFLSKEPDTIEWLNGLNEGDFFLDIGANIGVYSLYAAAIRGAVVAAVEPEAQNFSSLNRNIYTNKLQSRVTAWPFAAADDYGAAHLNLVRFQSGGGHNAVGTPINENGKPFLPQHIQGTMKVRLDQVPLFGKKGIRVPKFIKIDVDGIEYEVILGVFEWLENKNLEEILVETSLVSESGQKIKEILESFGFSTNNPALMRYNRGNYIFRRVQKD